jgi:hypothetical protein
LGGQPEAAHGPVHRGDADVPPALTRDALAQRCQRQLVLRAEEPCHDCQRVSAEDAAPAAAVDSREPAGQPALAPHRLDDGNADAALAGEPTPRRRALVAGWGTLGAYISGAGFQTITPWD